MRKQPNIQVESGPCEADLSLEQAAFSILITSSSKALTQIQFSVLYKGRIIVIEVYSKGPTARNSGTFHWWSADVWFLFIASFLFTKIKMSVDWCGFCWCFCRMACNFLATACTDDLERRASENFIAESKKPSFETLHCIELARIVWRH